MKNERNGEMNKNIKEKIAEIISTLFFPIINSIITFMLIIFFDKNITIKDQILFFSITIIFYIIIPMMSIMILKSLKKIESFDIFEREKRIIPLTMTVISYFIGFFVFSNYFEAPLLLKSLMLCYAINTFIVLIITFWWKVSIHALGVSGPIVALHFFFGNIIIPFYLIILLVGYSRVILKRHTVAQVVVGSFIGVFSTAIQIYFYLLLL